MNELLPLVDEEGRVLGSATRGECHGGNRPLHPVVHLHLFNSRGELYLQRRPEWKDVQPGKWDTAVGGHVDWGEDTETALCREVREEIGLAVAFGADAAIRPEFLCRYVFECQRERELVNVFRATYDGEVTPSAETDGGRFWSRQEILDAIGTGVLTPNFEQEWQRLGL